MGRVILMFPLYFFPFLFARRQQQAQRKRDELLAQLLLPQMQGLGLGEGQEEEGGEGEEEGGGEEDWEEEEEEG